MKITSRIIEMLNDAVEELNMDERIDIVTSIIDNKSAGGFLIGVKGTTIIDEKLASADNPREVIEQICKQDDFIGLTTTAILMDATYVSMPKNILEYIKDKAVVDGEDKLMKTFSNDKISKEDITWN